MSFKEWQDRFKRFQVNDLIVTLLVLAVVVSLVLYESLVLIQGKPASGQGISEGPLGRILLGILAAFTYFKTRQAHKDVVNDVGATTQMRERFEQDVAPAIRDATAKLDADTQQVVTALVQQNTATVQKIMEDKRVERHDLLGQLQAQQLLRQESEMEARALREKIGLLEGLVTAHRHTDERAVDRAEERAERAVQRAEKRVEECEEDKRAGSGNHA